MASVEFAHQNLITSLALVLSKVPLFPLYIGRSLSILLVLCDPPGHELNRNPVKDSSCCCSFHR